MENNNTFADVITACSKDRRMLEAQGYLCLDVFSKQNAEANRVRGLAMTKAIDHHYQAGDYKACDIVARILLDRMGIEKFKAVLHKALKESGKRKVALLDETGEGYGLRHSLALWLWDSGFDVQEAGQGEDFFNSIRQKIEVDIYKNTGVEIMSAEELEGHLEAHPWRKARTAVKNPHSYTLRPNWDNDLFRRVYLNVREKGEIEVFWDVVYRVFKGSKYAYWNMPDGFHWGTRIANNIILINKREI